MYWVALPLPTPLKPLSPLFPLREHLFLLLLLLLLLLCHFPAPHSSPSSSSDPLSATPVPAAARMSSNGICVRAHCRAHCAHCRTPRPSLQPARWLRLCHWGKSPRASAASYLLKMPRNAKKKAKNTFDRKSPPEKMFPFSKPPSLVLQRVTFLGKVGGWWLRHVSSVRSAGNVRAAKRGQQPDTNTNTQIHKYTNTQIQIRKIMGSNQVS